MERVLRRKRIPQPFCVDDLHVPDLIHVGHVYEFFETSCKEVVGTRFLAIERVRIGSFAPSNVKGPEAHPEVGSTTDGKNVLGSLTGIDVGASRDPHRQI